MEKIIKTLFQKIQSKLEYHDPKNKKKELNKILNCYELDLELKKHLKRVMQYAELLADLMCIDLSLIEQIKKGALLHDLGKLLIDNNILNKNIELTEKEFEHIKTHSKLGLSIILKKHKNKIVENIILFHHEKWNGKGYPFGLSEKKIPIEARIVSVADYYDAITSKRSYKNNYSHEEAVNLLKLESGVSFDPDIIAMFELFENDFKILLEK